MKLSRRRIVTLAGSLVLAAGAIASAAVPAGAATSSLPRPGGVVPGSLVPDSFAYGSSAQRLSAPAGAISGPNGLAESPPEPATTVVPNVSIGGLLSTGTATETAGATSAYAKVANVSAHLSWTEGPTTYAFVLTASQITSSCVYDSGGASGSVSFVGGTLTESARTGGTVTSQVFNLPQQPAGELRYLYRVGSPFGVVNLNVQGGVNGQYGAQAVLMTAPPTATDPTRTLRLAVTNCTLGGGPGAIGNGDFETGTTAGWTTTGSVTVVSGAAYHGTYAAQAGRTTPGTRGSSTIWQIFRADGTELAFAYRQSCTAGAGGVRIDLFDATTNTNVTVTGPSRCTTDPAWQTQAWPLTPGDLYRLTLTNTDTGGANPSYTLLDNVAVGIG